jgi:hypothetical protein
LVKEGFLGFPKWHTMEFPILLEVRIVPIEAGAGLERVLYH